MMGLLSLCQASSSLHPGENQLEIVLEYPENQLALYHHKLEFAENLLKIAPVYFVCVKISGKTCITYIAAKAVSIAMASTYHKTIFYCSHLSL